MDDNIERNEIRLTHLVAILLIPVSFGWIRKHDAATQDGPSHLAAAKIAVDWIRPSLTGEPAGTVRSFYRLHFEPVPNWGGQALGMALVATLPVSWAEVAMNLAGLWLPAISLAWLFETLRHPPRYHRAPRLETPFLALWITTTATNVLWTFGFSSFLLGTGLAWALIRAVRSYGESGGRRLWLIVTFLWCATFLCHLVAFAIAGIVAACIITFTPEWPFTRRVSIAASMAMVLPLLIRYRMLTGDSPLEPIWEHFRGTEILSIANWGRQIGWVDPVSLHSKIWHPWAGHSWPLGLVLQPALWVGTALVIVVASSSIGVITEFQEGVRFVERTKNILARQPSGRFFRRRELPETLRHETSLAFRLSHWRLPQCVAWSMAFGTLAILGMLGPDSLGARQGHYLPQRFLLAAVSIVPAVLVSTRANVPIPALGCIAVAWVLQTVSAIDFARRSHELTQPIRNDRAAIQPGDRILALIEAEPWPYRANPRLHADALLVTAAPDTVSWNLYEAAHPYFPLQFRQIVRGCDPATLEGFSLATGRHDPARTAASVHAILAASKGKADVVYISMDQDSDRRQTVMRAVESHFGGAMRGSGPHSVVYRNESPAARP